MTFARVAAVWVAVLASFAAGCSNPHTPVKVDGVVTLDGKPVEDVSVTFYRTGNDKEGRAAGGRTDADGRFQLSTLGDNDGVLPGDYVVIVSKWVSAKPNVKMPNFPDTPEGRFQKEEFVYKMYGDGPKLKNAFPEKYGDMEKSPFRFTISSETTIPLELTSK